MIAIYPVIAMIAGALAYALSANGKVAELGRLTFGAGCLVFLFVMAGHTVSVLGR